MARLFISHRGADTAEAERLARTLQGRGHDVWFDKWSICVGDSITGRMSEGLAECSGLILCLSAAGIEAPWIRQE